MRIALAPILLLAALAPAIALTPRCPPRLAARRSTAPLLSAASPAPPVPLIRRNSYRVATVTSLIALDILFYAFPLPFLPQHLSAAGHSAASISMLLASTSYAALFVGSGLVLVESRRRVPRSERRFLFLIAACAVAMTACAAAQAVLPVYNVLLLCRLVAGGVSQTVWSFGLALAASLGPVAGIKATAWCMAGNSLGEVLGPLFGSTLFGMGGVRRPYTVAAAVAAAIAGALVAGAAAAPPEPPAAEADAAAGEPASAGLGALADAPTVLLSTVLALGCGLQRAALDLLMPFSLRRAFGATPGVIGRASGVAALCFVVGSTVAGRALSARPEGALRWIALASVASSVATASMLLPGRQMLVCALFAAFYAASAVLGVAATTAIEERGAEIGNAQSAMAVSVFFWTIGFASGGLLASFALAGASSAARAQAVLAALGAANVAVALAVVARLRG
jgi:predicted MFS family arabinose efflux permease